MKDQIRPPLKVDRNGKRITGNEKAYRWKLNVPASITGTVKQRLFFTTEKAAKEKRDELLGNRQGLSAQQHEGLAARGMTVEDAIAYTLLHAPIVASVTVAKLLDDFVEHRIKEVGIGHAYERTLKSYCKSIKVTFGQKQIGEVTKSGIRSFLSALKSKDGKGPASPDTRNHYLETFVAVFNYAISEGMLNFNHANGISFTKSDDEEIHVLTVEQAMKLLEALRMPEHAEVAPAAYMQIFAAGRRSEMMLVKWELLVGKFLRLDEVKECTNPRPVEMPGALLEWLAPLRKNSGFVFDPKDVTVDRICSHISNNKARKKTIKENATKLGDAYQWRLERAAKSAGIKLPKNVLRHTAITMRVNESRDEPDTAIWAGTSVAKIHSNYLGKATPEDAQRFYALKPEAGNVVALPQGAAGESVNAAAPALKAEGHEAKSS